MAREEEHVLARWSRLKREHERGGPREREPDAPAGPVVPANAPHTGATDVPALPPIETLTPESDFTAFMGPKVADALRRAALKALFRHPEINVPDPFEPFCDDLTGGEPIPEGMLKSLLDARDAILRKPEAQAEAAQPQAPEARAPEARAPEPEPEPEPEAQVAKPTDSAGAQDA